MSLHATLGSNRSGLRTTDQVTLTSIDLLSEKDQRCCALPTPLLESAAHVGVGQVYGILE